MCHIRRPFIYPNKSVNNQKKRAECRTDPTLRTSGRRILCGILLASLHAHPIAANAGNTQTIQPNQSSSGHQSSETNKNSAEPKPLGLTPKRHDFEQADFENQIASQDARQVANWVVQSKDNRNMPFVIVDKTHAKVFVLNRRGQLRGAAPALLGLARGDIAVPGIGNRRLSNIHPGERTTPAGRFVASLAHNLHGEEILWVDYDTGISLHQVRTTNVHEHRARRLSSPTTRDNRISFGCINVPAAFYKNVVSPAFTGTNGIVYVLPDTLPLGEVFDF